MCKLFLQAPYEYLVPQTEQVVQVDGLRLHSKSLVLRFHLDFSFFINGDSRVKLKCVAKVNEVSNEIKESLVTIYIPAMDELNNQKLINWKNSGR